MNRAQIQHWYEQHKTGLYRYILAMTRDPQLSEDVLQDTFVRLMVGGVRFEPGKEGAWLYKVARNRCFDLLKRDKRTEAISLAEMSDGGERWEFMELISPLAPIEQEIVTLKIVGGLSHGEIAKVVGMTVAAAKKRYERAVKKLRDEMEV